MLVAGRRFAAHFVSNPPQIHPTGWPGHHPPSPCTQTVEACTASDLNRFLSGERKRGLAERSVYGCYRSLTRFFNWCEESQELGYPPSPMRNNRGKRVLSVRKPAQTEARRADVEIVDTLIASLPRGTWIQLRNRVALRLLRDTGVRLGEAVNVRLANLKLDERVLTIPKAKSRKSRQVRILLQI